MFKFLPSLIVLQILLVLVVLGAIQSGHDMAAVVVALFVLIAGAAFAFWFRSLSEIQNKDRIASLKEEHAIDREKIRLQTEQEKIKVISDAQQQITKQVSRANAKANFKAGIIITAAIGLGSLFIMGQMITLGLVTLTTAGGGIAGYMLRAMQERQKLNIISAGREGVAMTPDAKQQLKPEQHSIQSSSGRHED